MTHLIIAPSLVARLADAFEYFLASSRTSTFLAVGTGESDKRSIEQRAQLVEHMERSCDTLMQGLNETITAQHPDVPNARHAYWSAADALIERRWAERVKKHEARKARIAELQEERERAMELIAA